MTLSSTKPKDAEAMNTKGEGDSLASFAVANPKGEWFVNKGQYPMIDAVSGARFEAGVPTLAEKTTWVDSQIDAKSLEACDAPEDATGKAAKTVTEGAVETPVDPAATGMGAGMQSGVAGTSGRAS